MDETLLAAWAIVATLFMLAFLVAWRCEAADLALAEALRVEITRQREYWFDAYTDLRKGLMKAAKKNLVGAKPDRPKAKRAQRTPPPAARKGGG